ncbi:MAG: TerC family protein [Chloroflexi bacterium]|nr:TerC family protein [Chloroflexota bacterium]
MLDTGNIWLWVGFTVFVLGMLALDLGVFHRSAHAVSLKEAGIWSAVWISLALVFNAIIYFNLGPQVGLQFLTGYLIEKSLSVDNIFVFVLIFSYFSVPAMYQHRVLFWGIFGALVMRAILIWVGAALIEQFHWIIYVFGAFLVFTGIRMAFHKDEELHPDENPVVKLFKRFMPVVPEYHGQSFFVRHAGKLAATPLFVVLLLVESTDLVFALDSIPAIFAITTDPFIVYTSNVFAILGLRALYFLLAGVMDKFRYLKIGLSIVLVFVGVKMLIEALHITIPIGISLGVIAAVITGSILASLWKSSQEAKIETIDAGRHQSNIGAK